MPKKEYTADFTEEYNITDDDALILQIYLSAYKSLIIETGVVQDENGDKLPEKKGMENTLSVLRTALFTLSESFIDKFGDELDTDLPDFTEDDKEIN